MGNHSRVGFGAKNGDCGGESAVTYAKVCALDSPCKAPFLSPKSCREQTALPNIQSRASSTAIPRILEEENQAWRKNADTLESTFAKSPKMDSSTAPILSEQAQDSRICDEKTRRSRSFFSKSGLSSDWQGSYLSGNDRRDFSPLPHFSLKAESPQAQKPTPNQHKGANNATQSFHTIYTACGFYRTKQGIYATWGSFCPTCYK